MDYEPLPAINTFPQFNRSIGMISPLDLSLRSAIVPITPPSTPSPPRKRIRLMDDGNICNNLWRPHSFGYFENLSVLPWNSINSIQSTENLSEINKINTNTDSSSNHSKYQIDETIVLTEDEGNEGDDDDDDDEEFVDVISNDDDLPKTSIDNYQEKIESKENEKEQKIGVLTREKLVYEDIELHNKAIEGFAKLFKHSISKEQNQESMMNQEKEIPRHCFPTSQSFFKQIIRNKCEKRRFKIRKQLNNDEDNTSPVSGTIIRKLREDEELVVRKGDIDPAFNVVEITEEAKAIIASIDNKIGSYICQLCRTLYDDAFQLAQHRCTRIVHIEYRCSECDKVFNCPANLASHRRWHKPKPESMSLQKKQTSTEASKKPILPSIQSIDVDDNVEGSFTCQECGKGFRRQAYLKKHLTSHQMINDLKSSEAYRHSIAGPSTNGNYSFHNSSNLYHPHHPFSHISPHHRLYSGNIRFPHFFQNTDQRRIHPFNEFYFHNSNVDRLSAFQYVHGQGIHNLNTPLTGLDGIQVPPPPPLPLQVK